MTTDEKTHLTPAMAGICAAAVPVLTAAAAASGMPAAVWVLLTAAAGIFGVLGTLTPWWLPAAAGVLAALTGYLAGGVYGLMLALVPVLCGAALAVSARLQRSYAFAAGCGTAAAALGMCGLLILTVIAVKGSFSGEILADMLRDFAENYKQSLAPSGEAGLPEGLYRTMQSVYESFDPARAADAILAILPAVLGLLAMVYALCAGFLMRYLHRITGNQALLCGGWKLVLTKPTAVVYLLTWVPALLFGGALQLALLYFVITLFPLFFAAGIQDIWELMEDWEFAFWKKALLTALLLALCFLFAQAVLILMVTVLGAVSVLRRRNGENGDDRENP